MTVGGVGLNKGMYESDKQGRADASDNIARVLDRFNRDEFDLVGVGRSLLQDAQWTHKLRVGEPFEPFDQLSLKSLR